MNQPLPDPRQLGDADLQAHALKVLEVLIQRDLLSIDVPIIGPIAGPSPRLSCCSGTEIDSVYTNGPSVAIRMKTVFGEPERDSDDGE